MVKATIMDDLGTWMIFLAVIGVCYLWEKFKGGRNVRNRRN